MVIYKSKMTQGNEVYMRKIKIAATLQNYNKKFLPKDLFTGLIIAAVSIPISMGYAQIAGLPAVYGLYGSVFPIIIFSFFSTSKQFIFGVDAAPAALIASALVTLGVEPGTTQAANIVPIFTFCTAVWLFLLFLAGAGKLVNYISTPVMGGFITGICSTIILMQLPKLFGGSAEHGELFELLGHLFDSFSYINIPSLILGAGTLIILLLFKKIFPRFPVAILIMALSAYLSYKFDFTKYGVNMLQSVSAGLPDFRIPHFTSLEFSQGMGMSLSVAIVIMAETLLAENSFALKNDYKLNDNQEILAFSLANLIASFTGCCPVNGSVSRTSMCEQYGGKTQLTGIVAGISMMVLLLGGTGFIGYLPVPVLTAIVISALLGACEFDFAVRLLKYSRTEFYIFISAFLGVLVLGTIYGVMIGVVLSFVSVIIRATDPPRCFLGIMPGHNEFFNTEKFKHTYPIQNVVIYRFTSNLFFANINIFQNDIEGGIKDDTKAVIVDASGIGSVDVTAAERIELIYKSLRKREISFYLTEHTASLNDQLRSLGLGHLIREGAVRRTIPSALATLGIHAPYPIEGTHMEYHSVARKRAEKSIQEFVWAFGSDAETELEKMIDTQISNLKKDGNFDSLIHGAWNEFASMDEDEWLEHLEAHMHEIAKVSGKDELTIAQVFEKRRHEIFEKIQKEHPELAAKFMERRHQLDEQLKEINPELYEKIMKLRNK